MINGYSIPNGAKYFVGDGSQNNYVFQLVFRYKMSANSMIMTWKSKDLSDKSYRPPATSNYSFILRLYYFNNPKFRVEFNESCLKPGKVTCAPI